VSASAATFSVNPTQIFLSGRTTTALLTIKNDSDQPVRFQLSAFAWAQSGSGEMQLEETEDVVFFPALLTLGPKEERRVRIGSPVAAAARERTYRIFVEELPAVDSAAGGVRVLTKMGIPIFIRPAKATAAATLANLGLHNGELRFNVTNSGSVHFVPEKVVVRAVTAGGEPVFERELEAWYILAGGLREFQVPLSPTECASVGAFTVDVAFNSKLLRESLQTPAGACVK
jgi:fimbrial chaperone protein